MTTPTKPSTLDERLASVKFYDSYLGDECSPDECNAYMSEAKGGEYVESKDYDALLRAFDALLRQRDELIEICKLNPLIDDIEADDAKILAAYEGTTDDKR